MDIENATTGDFIFYDISGDRKNIVKLRISRRDNVRLSLVLAEGIYSHYLIPKSINLNSDKKNKIVSVEAAIRNKYIL